MGDRIDRMLLDQAGDQIGVADVADGELCARRNGPGKAGREIVDNHDRLAGVDEPQPHVAADIAGAASHQYAHASPPVACLTRP